MSVIVYKGNEHQFIPPEQLEYCLQDGWSTTNPELKPDKKKKEKAGNQKVVTDEQEP